MNNSLSPIIIISAIGAQNRAIGYRNKLLWHIPEDMKFFRENTTGHVIVMGRKTFDSIGRPLPNRGNIVITRSGDFKVDGVHVAKSPDEALEFARQNLPDKKIFIIGGGEIYRQFIDQADELLLTIVDLQTEADAFFPEFEEDFKMISETETQKSADGDTPFRFSHWTRNK